jgi:hypothetical protein
MVFSPERAFCNSFEMANLYEPDSVLHHGEEGDGHQNSLAFFLPTESVLGKFLTAN